MAQRIPNLSPSQILLPHLSPLFLCVAVCLDVSRLTLWPLCKTGDDLVFGDV
ncbi:hypothetical protein JOQ06_006684, partial [Pogonophryne albipinna]